VQEIIALDISTYGNKSIHPTPPQPANLPNKTNAPSPEASPKCNAWPAWSLKSNS
jgi:hypothetical protein